MSINSENIDKSVYFVRIVDPLSMVLNFTLIVTIVQKKVYVSQEMVNDQVLITGGNAYPALVMDYIPRERQLYNPKSCFNC